jgi:hypothetical protein
MAGGTLAMHTHDTVYVLIADSLGTFTVLHASKAVEHTL